MNFFDEKGRKINEITNGLRDYYMKKGYSRNEALIKAGQFIVQDSIQKLPVEEQAKKAKEIIEKGL